MMTLESLREVIAAQYTEIQAAGRSWRVGKLLAADYLALMPLMKEAASETGAEPANAMPYYVAILSKTLCDQDGKRIFDNEEGKSLLGQLDGPELVQLGIEALSFNTSKKK